MDQQGTNCLQTYWCHNTLVTGHLDYVSVVVTVCLAARTTQHNKTRPTQTKLNTMMQCCYGNFFGSIRLTSCAVYLNEHICYIHSQSFWLQTVVVVVVALVDLCDLGRDPLCVCTVRHHPVTFKETVCLLHDMIWCLCNIQNHLELVDVQVICGINSNSV